MAKKPKIGPYIATHKGAGHGGISKKCGIFGQHFCVRLPIGTVFVYEYHTILGVTSRLKRQFLHSPGALGNVVWPKQPKLDHKWPPTGVRGGG